MAVKEKGAAAYIAPASYEDLFRSYFPLVISVIQGSGINNNNLEDVAMDILIKFIERDFLTKYDANYINPGSPKPARFANFLTGFVRAYLPGHFDRQSRLRQRELYVLDDLSSEDGVDLAIKYLKVPRDFDEEVIARVDAQQLIQRFRRYLLDVERTQRSTRSIVEFYDIFVDDVLTKGEHDISSLKARLGVGDTCVHKWSWRMRTALANATGRTCVGRGKRIVPCSN